MVKGSNSSYICTNNNNKDIKIMTNQTFTQNLLNAHCLNFDLKSGDYSPELRIECPDFDIVLDAGYSHEIYINNSYIVDEDCNESGLTKSQKKYLTELLNEQNTH